MEQVSSAVKQAELTTSGEIVPMIVRRSSAIGHVKIILALLFLLIFATLDIVGTHYASDLTVWFYEKVGLDFLTFLGWFTAIGAILTFPIASLMAQIPGVQRCLTPDEDLAFEVLERAQLEFYWTNIVKTEARTGILIFLSLMERRCVVLADEGISKHLPKDVWDEVVKVVVDGIRTQKSSEGLSSAIKMCGDILAKYFPPNALNPDELSNSLIVKD